MFFWKPGQTRAIEDSNIAFPIRSIPSYLSSHWKVLYCWSCHGGDARISPLSETDCEKIRGRKVREIQCRPWNNGSALLRQLIFLMSCLKRVKIMILRFDGHNIQVSSPAVSASLELFLVPVTSTYGQDLGLMGPRTESDRPPVR
jgi:hypothetical protein